MRRKLAWLLRWLLVIWSWRAAFVLGEYVRDLVEQCVDDALQEPQRVVKDVLRRAVRTVACSKTADDAEEYVKPLDAAAWLVGLV